MSLLSEDFIRDITKRAPSDFQQAMIDNMCTVLQKYNINTPLRVAHFLAQAMHESAEFTANIENLNYSEGALTRVFSRYFKSSRLAEEYARNPQRIANRVYSNRMGNGDEQSGDGWKYRGRGIFQLTGKSNYIEYGDKLGIDLERDPDLARDPIVSLAVACEYWKSRNINDDADNDDIYTITKKINGGLNGIDHRISLYNNLINEVRENFDSSDDTKRRKRSKKDASELPLDESVDPSLNSEGSQY